MTPLDPDRTLALTYVPAAAREAVRTLWQLDAQLGSVLTAGREPMISRIKLAWWREALEKLDSEPAPSEPMLQAASDHLLPRGVSGSALAALESGWAVLLQEEALEAEDLQAYAAGRGANLFRLTAQLLGSEAGEDYLRAGEMWALADLGRHSGEPDARAARDAARAKCAALKWPPKLRPLGMLAVLAARDLDTAIPEPQGSPGRMLRMLKHRITGR